MDKRFLIFLAAGLLIAGAATYFFYAGTKDAVLSVSGEILKTRTVVLSPHNVCLLADFRIRNTSSSNFLLKEATVFVTMADGKEKEGRTLARDEVQNVVKFTPLAGPQYNQVLGMRDKVGANVTIDRMVAATFSVEEQDLATRKKVRLHLTDLDGKEFDLLEKSAKQ